jgi:hypothetical protein
VYCTAIQDLPKEKKMSKFVTIRIAKFARHFARVLLAASFVVCAVPVGSTILATPAAAATFNGHAAWAGFSTVSVSLTVDGSNLVGRPVVRGGDWIEIPDVTRDVFAMSLPGAVAVIDHDDGGIKMKAGSPWFYGRAR